MAREYVKQEILKQLDRLPYEVQRQVLNYVRTLASFPKGVPGKQLVRFAGTLSEEDARVMSQAIEIGCEQVDTDEW
ncbi:MAG TPA: hypothetical protein GXX19_12210 [Syntrophomonadaceae bacterium]|nr:hypothetical protein [Syntrophomonadaceae bacterium]